MAGAESEHASLLTRYQELKSSLLNELERVNKSSEEPHILRHAVKEWHAVAKNLTVPAGVHYLLERHPHALDVDTSKAEIATVVKELRKIARDEDIEVFITVLEFGPGEDARLVHMADRHQNDYHEYFVADDQEILQSPIEFLGVGDNAEACLPPTQNRVVST